MQQILVEVAWLLCADSIQSPFSVSRHKAPLTQLETVKEKREHNVPEASSLPLTLC